MRLDVSHNEVLGTISSLGILLRHLLVRRAAHHAEHDCQKEVALASVRSLVSLEHKNFVRVSSDRGAEALLV
jgi:hypothetical protein